LELLIVMLMIQWRWRMGIIIHQFWQKCNLCRNLIVWESGIHMSIPPLRTTFFTIRVHFLQELTLPSFERLLKLFCCRSFRCLKYKFITVIQLYKLFFYIMALLSYILFFFW
jgi:hypothetical protein